MTSSNQGQLSDQAAYNVLINLNHFKENVQFVNQEEGFVTQLGTVLIKKDEFKNVLLEPTPIYSEGKLYTQYRKEFCLIHQYDRDSKLKNEFYQKYK